MRLILIFLVIVVFCMVLITGCGVYTPEEIIVNEPLVINVEVDVLSNVTNSSLINDTVINDSVINDTE